MILNLYWELVRVRRSVLAVGVGIVPTFNRITRWPGRAVRGTGADCQALQLARQISVRLLQQNQPCSDDNEALYSQIPECKPLTWECVPAIRLPALPADVSSISIPAGMNGSAVIFQPSAGRVVHSLWCQDCWLCLWSMSATGSPTSTDQMVLYCWNGSIAADWCFAVVRAFCWGVFRLVFTMGRLDATAMSTNWGSRNWGFEEGAMIMPVILQLLPANVWAALTCVAA